ncbi:MAG: TetR family transcriptional regulator [Pseudomonadales bacterium]|nr:TetR family transcriptional regulator [Pseudomonadales bacterium]MCP5183738.1 TetR family transcriptional regulator [Pseudomonadales bacterium]
MTSDRSNNDARRQEIVLAVADHLVREGLGNSGIRALAGSAGLSDRMLMYYFETKDDLIAQCLMLLARNMAAGLETLLPARPAPAHHLVATLTDPALVRAQTPVLRLWFEIVGLAVRGNEPYRSAVERILADWQAWLVARLRADQQGRAAELLAEVEGRLLLMLLREHAG